MASYSQVRYSTTEESIKTDFNRTITGSTSNAANNRIYGQGLSSTTVFETRFDGGSSK
jgi:hypothetical protein